MELVQFSYDWWWQAAEGASSATTSLLEEPINAVAKESGVCESQGQEVRSADPTKKQIDACGDVVLTNILDEKSPVMQVDGEPLVSPMSLGALKFSSFSALHVL